MARVALGLASRARLQDLASIWTMYQVTTHAGAWTAWTCPETVSALSARALGLASAIGGCVCSLYALAWGVYGDFVRFLLARPALAAGTSAVKTSVAAAAPVLFRQSDCAAEGVMVPVYVYHYISCYGLSAWTAFIPNWWDATLFASLFCPLPGVGAPAPPLVEQVAPLVVPSGGVGGIASLFLSWSVALIRSYGFEVALCAVVLFTVTSLRPRRRITRWVLTAIGVLSVARLFAVTHDMGDGGASALMSVAFSRFPRVCKWLAAAARLSTSGPARVCAWLVSYLAEAEWDIVSFAQGAYTQITPLAVIRDKPVPHSLRAGTLWQPAQLKPEQEGMVAFYVKEAGSDSLALHSMACVGSDCLVGLAHCFHDGTRGLGAFHTQGAKVYFAHAGATVTSGSKLGLVPSHFLESLNDPTRRISHWRGPQDSVTARDLTVVYFKSAGAHFRTIFKPSSFGFKVVPNAQVLSPRCVDKLFRLSSVATALDGGEEGPILFSTVGSEPGMSGAPVVSTLVSGVLGFNMGFDPVLSAGIILGAKQVGRYLVDMGCVRKGTIAFNAEHESYPLPVTSKVPVGLREEIEAHAPRASRIFRDNGRRESGEKHGAHPEQGVEAHWREQEEKRAYHESGRDADTDMLTEGEVTADHGAAFAAMERRDRKFARAHALEPTPSPAPAEPINPPPSAESKVEPTTESPPPPGLDDPRKNGYRMLRAAIRKEAHCPPPDPFRFDTGELTAGKPLKERVSLEENLRSGVRHAHKCGQCGTEYTHIHSLRHGDGSRHDQWAGQCPNQECDRFHPRAVHLVATEIIHRIDLQAHALKPQDLEGLSVSDAMKELRKEDRPATSRLTARVRESKRDNIARISEDRHKMVREAHCIAPKFVPRAPINGRALDLSSCAICAAAAPDMDGVCPCHKRCCDYSLPTPGGSAVVAAIKADIEKTCPHIVARLAKSGYSWLSEPEPVTETATKYSDFLFQVVATSRHVNDPGRHAKPSKAERKDAAKWYRLAQAAGVDPSAFFMPPNTLEALVDSLAANCEKRIKPTVSTMPWASLARYIAHHVVDPLAPTAEELAGFELTEEDIQDVLDGEWSDFSTTNFEDFQKEVERRVRKAVEELNRDKSTGFDKFIHKHGTKGALVDSSADCEEVIGAAVERICIFAKYGEKIKELDSREILQLGLRDPAVPVLKNEATPARKVVGQRYKRWRSIMVGSVVDELVDRFAQKGHNARMVTLFQMGADTWSHIGTGSDDRHVMQTKTHVARGLEAADQDAVLLTADVSGMDFCMGAVGYGISAACRLSTLYCSPRVGAKDRVWLANVILGVEAVASLQSLMYGDCLLAPVERCVNKSGVVSTSFNNTHACCVVAMEAGGFTAIIVGDDGIYLFFGVTEEEAQAQLTAAGARMGYDLRQMEVGTGDDFESCSKRFLGGTADCRFRFLNLDKAFAKAVMSQSWGPAVADGLAFECRYSKDQLERIQKFHDAWASEGLGEPHVVSPEEDVDGDQAP